MADKFLVPIDLAQSDTVNNPPAGFTRVQAFTDGSVRSISPAGAQVNLSTGAVSMQVARLAANQATGANTTPIVLTGFSFTIPPGKTALITVTLITTCATTANGSAQGVRVTQGAGANGNAVGSWFSTNAVTSAAAATALEDGDVYNVAAGTTSAAATYEVLSTDHLVANSNTGKLITAIIRNTSTNANTTADVTLRSEGTVVVNAIAGSSATCIIG